MLWQVQILNGMEKKDDAEMVIDEALFKKNQ